MKLSEAIREGIKLCPEKITGGFFARTKNGIGACSIGCALAGAGKEFISLRRQNIGSKRLFANLFPIEWKAKVFYQPLEA